MRSIGRDSCRMILVPAIVLLAAVAAHAEGPLGISEIRLTSVEEPAEADENVQLAVAEDAQEKAAPEPAPEPAADSALAAGAKPVQHSSKTPPFRRNRPTAARAPVDPPIATNQMRHALNFYGGQQARATLSQFPARSPIQAGPQQPMQRQLKPFHTIYRDPTVSPYLNLYREENDSEGAPNYFAFVRPELEQIEANRTASREIQQLSKQMQGRSRSVASPQYQLYPSTGASGRRTPARYMDTAQFYGGWSR